MRQRSRWHLPLLLIVCSLPAAHANETPTRIYLFTAALPPGIDVDGTARRQETMNDVRRLLLKEPGVVLTDEPDDASVTIEVSARRLVRSADEHTTATVDLRLSAGSMRGEVTGAATRSVAVWRDAALHAVEAALRWIYAR